jgi:hypothetical protein
MILYLFYNADLLKALEGLNKISGMAWVDDVGAMAQGESAEANCELI